ncbi:MAG TPA: tRNA lysidine(34) synthetase TilS, partial [Candidatus Cloacimonadota bacterium]|nr:tRNA lysidine(34) synthetase TilS [Candidatus Cloacimonadota bacterium]
PKYSLSLLIAHVNYHLRGENSNQDAVFVKDYCFRHNLSIVMKDVELKTKTDLENEARKIRRNYFDGLLKTYNMDVIALGHQQLDQAETFLMNMIRGAGLTGMHAILPQAGPVIHPMLPFSKNEITDFLKAEEIQWREDESNKDKHYRRNMVRLELIPWIEQNMNPAIVEHLSDLASVFASADSFIRDAVKSKLKQLILEQYPEKFIIDLPQLKSLNPVLRFYVCRDIYCQLTGTEQNFFRPYWEEIESLYHARGSKYTQLPDHVFVIREYSELTFTTIDPNLQPEEQERELSNLRNRFVFGSYRIDMKRLKGLPSKRHPFEDKNTVFFDADKILFPLYIRYRKDGDVFKPLGLNGSKKLKDFFIDEKIPKTERDKIPLFVDQEKILWVSGMRVDQRVAVSASTKNILMIHIEKTSEVKPRSAERITKDGVEPSVKDVFLLR